MGIGAVNYWANTEVKLFERGDGLRLILEELKKRNVEEYNDLLECGGLAALASQYTVTRLTAFEDRKTLLAYLRDQQFGPLLEKKIKEVASTAPKPPENLEDMSEQDYKNLMNSICDCSELLYIKYLIDFLQGGLEKQLERKIDGSQ